MRSFLVLLAATCLAVPALAVPQLQLDILGGTYDPDTDTIIAPEGQSLTLVALLTPNGNPSQEDIDALLAGAYYISVALVPKTESEESGSFVFAGDTVMVSDMVYGVPPLEDLIEQDPQDLSQHGVFETLFWQSPAFFFSADDTADTYDTADDPGGLVVSEFGETFFRTFVVDSSLLPSGYQLHFDLYNTVVVEANMKKAQNEEGPDVDADDFAPFSHDAQTNRNGHELPEPGTLVLLGAGLLACFARKRRL